MVCLNKVFHSHDIFTFPFAGLMGMFEKRRFRNFLAYCQTFDDDKPATWKLNPDESSMNDLYAHFKLDCNVADFTGHALALYTSDA